MAISHPENPVRSAGALKRFRNMLDKDWSDAEPCRKKLKTEIRKQKRAILIANALLRGSKRLADTPYGPAIHAAAQAWKRHAKFLPYENSVAVLKKKYSFYNYNKEVRRYVCHGLLEKIAAQEIRDQIYGYLVEPGLVTLVESSDSLRDEREKDHRYVGSRRQACLSSRDQEYWSFDFLCKQSGLPEIFQCEHVGHKFLVELVQHWYRVNTFAIELPDDLSLIPDFTIQDRWQLGIVPRDHIKTIMFSIHMAFVERDGQGAPPPQLPLLRKGLEQFLHFNPGTKIKFTVRTSSPPGSRFISSAFSSRNIVSRVPHAWGLWARNETEILEIVKDLESGLFDTFRRLCDAGLLLEFNMDPYHTGHDLEIMVNHKEEITYDSWAEKVLAYRQVFEGRIKAMRT
ncbi:uncharacterized protein J4E92_010269 [Alternaria infectoria]|uniref:uncharacterized protein n=1 Tax=Alternaria infectoria TaxID=45303 RepID=UPI00221E3CF1|nr:uncharacterized protein J4E92_010269 [Alternaria infectoria]KAI4911456.1 hypothetical protein J4E92_010269 [Alternaria infectoria]